jgi:hypothetical protein
LGTGRFTFLRLHGRKHRHAPGAPAGPDLGLFLHGRGDYAFDVIGAAPFGASLRDIASAGAWTGERQGCIASLVCRGGTPLERNTVAIEIAGRTVGYCPSYLAAQYREWLEKWHFSAASAQCNAIIIGRRSQAEGPPSVHGVKLDIELPFKVTTL